MENPVPGTTMWECGVRVEQQLLTTFWFKIPFTLKSVGVAALCRTGGKVIRKAWGVERERLLF